MSYFTIDGHYRLVYGPHFFILLHLRWGKKINLAAFLFQSLEHSINLAREGEGPILHQGLLYLLFKFVASPAELSLFPPKHSRPHHTPTSSPIPSPASHPPPAITTTDKFPLTLTPMLKSWGPPSQVLFPLPPLFVYPPQVWPVSLTLWLWWHSLLLLLPPAQSSTSQTPCLGLLSCILIPQNLTRLAWRWSSRRRVLTSSWMPVIIIMEDHDTNPQDVQMDVVPNWKDSASGNIEKANTDSAVDTENQPEDRHVELVTSILAKLKRSFSVLKA
ncbi:hypothetical protein KI387_041565 [Taxus chinensis]|uniref:Uncharacterized protein n=1 Tax=Taxus chinensis TaxID=29808 RepID=A0AA38F9N9_TAXCH|nr:hypothetical protein KI387_041565 [Taxus chinensis]